MNDDNPNSPPSGKLKLSISIYILRVATCRLKYEAVNKKKTFLQKKISDGHPNHPLIIKVLLIKLGVFKKKYSQNIVMLATLLLQPRYTKNILQPNLRPTEYACIEFLLAIFVQFAPNLLFKH